MKFLSNSLLATAVRVIRKILIGAVLGSIGTSFICPERTVQAADGLLRLRVSSNGHFLEKSDGTPFFWMGDTVWFLPKLSASDIDLYLSDSALKGFNGAFIDLSYYFFEPVGDPPYLDGDTDTPNETYWQKVDWIVNRADKYGIYTALVVMWGGDYDIAFGTDTTKAYRLGRWLGHRYSSRNNVLWIISGEYAEIASRNLDMFNMMAQGIRAGGGSQLMTIHPACGPCSSSDDFHNSSWLDFNILQSGQEDDLQADGFSENYELIDRDYNLPITKPTMDGEPAYEDSVDDWFTTEDVNGRRIGPDAVRRKAYWAVFAGAFGHTYGHYSLENLFVPGEIFPTYPIPYPIPSWEDALNAPGRVQMRYLRSLVESRPILGRIPDQSILISNPGRGVNHVQATRASDRSYAWVYIATGGDVTIDLSKLAGPEVSARWYSPRDGSYTSIGQYTNASSQVFSAPGSKERGNDWILVLDSQDPDPAKRDFGVAADGATVWTAPDTGTAVTTGYAKIEDQRSTAEGIAIFGFRKDGVLVSEASVTAVQPSTSGRIFAEVSDRVDTGIAIANPNNTVVTISFSFTDADGNDVGAGMLTIARQAQMSRFLSEAPFSSGRILGTFTFRSSLPVAVVALRGLTNEKGQFLVTTLPVSPLAAPSGELVFPHFIEGAGWSMQVVLVNPTDETISGALHFYDEGTSTNTAQPLTVSVGNENVSSVAFLIQPRSAQRVQTSGEGTIQVGSIRVTPAGQRAPSGVAILEYRNLDGVTTSAVGVAAQVPDRTFRVYGESNGSTVQTGVAIANTLPSDARINIDLFDLGGRELASASFSIPGNGHTAKFLKEISGFETVSRSFQGVIRVTGNSAGLSGVALRIRINERQDVVTTMIPVIRDSDSASGIERYFPHVAYGGGYTTQFVLFSGHGQSASGTLRYVVPSGEPLP